jgi:cell division protein FtsW
MNLRRKETAVRNSGILRADTGILFSTLLMMAFGIVLVYSSSFPVAQQKFGGSDFFLARQSVRAFLGIIFFIVFMNIDYHILGRMSRGIFIVALIMLAGVLLLPDSMAVNGAKRWIQLGSIRFQVSDFARIAMIIAIASDGEKIGGKISEGGSFLKLAGKTGMIAGLVLLEPNYSTAFILGCIGMIMLFTGGAPVKWMAGGLAALAPVALIVMAAEPYRRARLLGYLHMSTHKQTAGYQAHQALIGLGNGGIFGVGLGGAERKFMYLPESHTDFAFSILGEELGLIGLIVVLSLFGFMVYRGLFIASRAPDRMGKLMATGFTAALGMYVLVHAGVNTGILPTTGIPLPFLSYGGMSIIFTMASMGILLNISSQAMSGSPLYENNRGGRKQPEDAMESRLRRRA